MVPLVGQRDAQTLLIITAGLVLFAVVLKNLAVVAVRWRILGQPTRATSAAQT
ncbi:hypothetical protein M3E18_07445 [Kocuria sp. p3-SID1433]|uniref:hypothetical protein n=1 Tax=unclassified Kocuria TaxID=2649579 RepID=UPI0021A26C2B|nr:MULTISPECIES: hypothetical protein [unclassified Kocuria]MCT1602081.1 hypothetical protein [Kocuria sp. p3-SID1428]MCT2180364.1 hypothetical protein [Kocuria sp. p3-SID1433]